MCADWSRVHPLFRRDSAEKPTVSASTQQYAMFESCNYLDFVFADHLPKYFTCGVINS